MFPYQHQAVANVEQEGGQSIEKIGSELDLRLILRTRFVLHLIGGIATV